MNDITGMTNSEKEMKKYTLIDGTEKEVEINIPPISSTDLICYTEEKAKQMEATISSQAKIIGSLNQENYVMNGLLNGKEKEIVRDLQKLQDMQNECDTCIRQDCEVAGLEKEIKELKAKLSANRFIFKTTVRNEYLDKITELELQRDGQGVTIMELNRTIEKQIAYTHKFVQDTAKIIENLKAQPKLNKEKLEEIFDEELPDAFDYNEEKRYTITDQNNIITAILNLAIPEIDKEKLAEDIINKLVLISHDVHNNGSHYKYVLDDINLEDIKQSISEIIGGK